jgi:hypothetical protein
MGLLSAAASRFFTRKMTTDFCLAATNSLWSGVAPVEGVSVALVIRRITIAVLAAFLAGAVLAVPASSNSGPATVAKKKAKKCKKGKKKRKGCKSGSSSVGLPGEATPASPKQPNTPPPPPDNPVLQVSSLTLTPGTVLGGNPTTGHVTLDAVAPTGGQQVDLTSNVAPPRVQLPPSVVVVAGQKTASFQVDTTSGAPVTATLTASIGASSAGTNLKVVDKPSVESVQLQRKCFTVGDTTSNNLVTLDIPAPSNTDVALESGDPLLLFLPVTSVMVPMGSTSQFFTVNALAPSTGDVSVTATAPSTPPQSDFASVYAAPPDANADTLTLNPGTVEPDSLSTATVTLDCEAPPSGTTVSFASQSPSNVHVPPPILIEPGQLSATFQVTVDPGTPDDNYEISATAGEGVANATLTVSSVLPT